MSIPPLGFPLLLQLYGVCAAAIFIVDRISKYIVILTKLQILFLKGVLLLFDT